jgi:WD40 repeat protein
MDSNPQQRSPYQGLIPYGEDDAPFFFGREKETRLITANLFASSLTLLYGASGVGKSSVLRAGVAHQLRQRDDLLVVVFNAWQRDPTNDLKAKIAAAAALVDSEITPPSASLSLTDYVTTYSQKLDRRLMIILDQFEEYFLYHAQDDTFADEFARALLKTDTSSSFLISIREDFYAKLDRFEGRIPALYDNYIRIEHLDRKAARAALEKPIEEFNRLRNGVGDIRLEPALVEAVLKQVETGQVVIGEAGRGTVGSAKPQENAHARIETPFLQLVMTRLWDEEMRAQSATLRLATLERLGGAESIVRTHLDAVMSAQQPQDQDVASGIFHYLVTPSGTKIAYTASDLAQQAELDKGQVVRVLEKLSHGDLRILRPVDPPLDQPSALRYEIFHDVLAPAVLSWCAAYVQRQKDAEAERGLALEAQERAKAEQQLQRERALARSLRWALVGLAVLLVAMGGLTIWAFQQKNIAKTAEANAIVARGEVEKQKDLVVKERDTANKARGDAEAANTETQKANIEANTKRIEADQAKVLAQQSAAAALQAEGEAVKQRRIAEVQQKVAQGRELTASAVSRADIDPELSVVLAKKAIGILPVNQSEDSLRATDILRQALLKSHTQAVMRGHRNAVQSAAFSPDGKFIVTASKDSSVRVWNATTGKSIHELEEGGNPVKSATFSPDGELVLLIREPDNSSSQNVEVWDPNMDLDNAPQEDMEPLGSTRQIVAGLHGETAAFTSDSRFVIAVGSDERAEIWDRKGQRRKELPPGQIKYRGKVNNWFSSNGEFVFTASNYETAEVWEARYGHEKEPKKLEMDRWIEHAVLSPDGKLAVSSSTYNGVKVWDVESGKVLGELTEKDPQLVPAYPKVESLTMSSDGSLVLLGMLKGMASVWEVRTRRKVADLQGRPGDWQTVAFSPDNKFVVAGGASEVASVWNLESRQNIAVLRGHTGPLLGVAFNPNGKEVVTASFDGTARISEWESEKWRSNPIAQILNAPESKRATFDPSGQFAVTLSEDLTPRVWEPRTGRLLAELRGHTGQVRSAQLSHDGKLIVTTASDGTRVWDATTGGLLKAMGPAGALDAGFSPDDKHIVSTNSTVQILDTTSGRVVRELVEKNGTPLSAAFSADGKYILTTSTNRSVTLWDPATGRVVRSFPNHRETIAAAHFSPDGTLVVSADDYAAEIYEVSTGRRIRELNATEFGPITNAVFSPDSKFVAVTSLRSVVVLEAATGKQVSLMEWTQIRSMRGDEGYVLDHVRAAAFSPDSKFLAAAQDRIARVWKVETGELVTILDGGDSVKERSATIAFSPDGKLIVTANQDNTMLVWDWGKGGARNSEPIAELRGQSGLFSPDGKLLVTVGGGDTAQVWNAGNGQRQVELQGMMTGNVTDLVFSGDGKHILTTSDNGLAWIWERDTGRNVSVLQTSPASDVVRSPRWPINSGSFSFDGKLAVTTTTGYKVSIWNVVTARKVASLNHPTKGVNTAAFSPDGKFIVTAGDDNNVRVWKLPTLTNDEQIVPLPEVTLRGHTGLINKTVFSPNGKLIITASNDGTARVWEWQTAAPDNPLILRGNTGEVDSAAFSPNGQLIVTSTADGQARLWEASTGQSLVELIGTTGPLLNVAFSADGKSIIAASDKAKYIYSCAICGTIEDIMAESKRVKRELTKEEAKKYLHVAIN